MSNKFFILGEQTEDEKPKTLEELLTPSIKVTPVNSGFLVSWSVSNVVLLANAKVKLSYAIHTPENIVNVYDVTGLNHFLIPFLQHYQYGQKYQWVKLTVEKRIENKLTIVETKWHQLFGTSDNLLDYVSGIQRLFIEGQSSVLLFLYKLKYGGELCSKCFNYTLMKPSDPFCPECLGTGFKDGYWPAKPIKALIIGSPQKVLVRKYYLDTPTAWTFRTMSEHFIGTGDVLFLPATGTWLTVSHLVEQRYGAIPFTSIVFCAELDEDSIQARALEVPPYDIKEADLNIKLLPTMPDVEK